MVIDPRGLRCGSASRYFRTPQWWPAGGAAGRGEGALSGRDPLEKRLVLPGDFENRLRGRRHRVRRQWSRVRTRPEPAPIDATRKLTPWPGERRSSGNGARRFECLSGVCLFRASTNPSHAHEFFDGRIQRFLMTLMGLSLGNVDVCNTQRGRIVLVQCCIWNCIVRYCFRISNGYTLDGFIVF